MMHYGVDAVGVDMQVNTLNLLSSTIIIAEKLALVRDKVSTTEIRSDQTRVRFDIGRFLLNFDLSKKNEIYQHS